MELLEKIYHQTTPRVEFNFRNLSLILEENLRDKKENIVISGVSQSGKTALIFLFLGEFEEKKYIYIDLFEYRREHSRIFENLPNFIENNQKIEFIILETYGFDILEFQNILEKIQKFEIKIIITSWFSNLEFKNFKNIELFPLNFEEFLTFKPSNENLEHSLSRFLKVGTFPFLANKSDSFYTHQILRFLSFSLSENEILILENSVNFIGSKVSFYTIFQNIKKYHKISKDKFYSALESIQNKHYLLSLNEFIFDSEKKNSKKNVRKIYLIDPMISSNFSGKKDFISVFENFIFLELLKKGEKVTFFESINFYIFSERKIVLSLPFGFEEHIQRLLKKISKSIEKIFVRKIEIVTLNFETSTKLNDLNVEVISFSRWALTL